jgi:hypothetical protein
MITARHQTRAFHVNQLARLALFSFLVTFIISRTFVLLIMAHRIPNFYFFLQGTHVHHLNYGIFLPAWRLDEKAILPRTSRLRWPSRESSYLKVIARSE